MSNTQDIFFAAVGDVHGNMHSMVRDLKAWEKKHNHQLAFVLQVGDFEPQRDEADLVTTPGSNSAVFAKSCHRYLLFGKC